MSKHVLVVGGTGRLGTKLVRELLARGATVRVTYRHTAPDLDGVELVAADLADAVSLDQACAGIDVVVSAVQGLGDVIVDGQTRLLRVAEKAGVTRMLPSDYSVDFTKTADGGNRNLDLRRDFNRVLDASKVRGTTVLCGAFMDMLGWGMGPDPKTNVYRVWGDADQPFDFTRTDDVAAYLAAVAIDDDAPRIVRVAGDTKSPREIAAIFEEVRGVPITIERLGSIDDLSAAIDQMKAADPAPANTFPRWQQMQYARDMASGEGRLSPLDNARYPDVTPMDIRTFVRQPRA